MQRTANVQSLERPSKVKLFKALSESDGLKCLDEHTSLDDYNTPRVLLGQFVGSTVDGVHDASRGTVINGGLLAAQHSGPQTQRSKN